MTDITAAMVKELRESTGAGMMDCKAALSETNGDMEAAVDWLRKKGLSKAAKKSSRVAAEGLVAVTLNGDETTGAVVEVNAETDFVARNEQFQQFATKVASIALTTDGDVAALNGATYGGSEDVQTKLTNLIATIGENMSLRRFTKLSVTNGVVAAYVHNQLSAGLGKIGVLVALESTGDKEKLKDLGKQLAMHVAAANPQFLNITSVDGASLDRERDVYRDQAKASGKPDDIVEKMVEGRIRKYYEEVVLLEQTFIMDGESKITKLLESAAKDVGAPVQLTGFVRYALGEGIEKEETDFAAEVAAAVNG